MKNLEITLKGEEEIEAIFRSQEAELEEAKQREIKERRTKEEAQNTPLAEIIVKTGLGETTKYLGLNKRYFFLTPTYFGVEVRQIKIINFKLFKGKNRLV